ncbi:MAG: T9SS type A sorting domain-containing protein [bacterium]|nr:T9SS type A sorting domain-containing protein [bacterium]
MEVVVRNKGHMDANLDFARLVSSSSYIKFISQMDSSKIIYVGQEGSVAFQLSLLNTAPEACMATFSLSFVTLEKYVITHSFRLTCIAGFFDNMEYGANSWSHQAQGNPANKNDDWQWGRPLGSAQGQDPGAAVSGFNCWGNDLGGPGSDGFYENNMNSYLKTPMIDCSRYSKVGLKFMRWLSVCPGDVAKILVNDSEVWTSPVNGLYDAQWTEQIIDISAIADGNPNVTISFGLTTNGSDVAGGWNIDDVMVKDQLVSSVATLAEQKIPENFMVIQNYPNPFNSSTIIRYQLATDGNVVLKIVNVLGQEVRRLVDQKQSAGNQSILWDGKDLVGSNVTSGVYLVSIEMKDHESGTVRSRMRKILLVR